MVVVDEPEEGAGAGGGGDVDGEEEVEKVDVEAAKVLVRDVLEAGRGGAGRGEVRRGLKSGKEGRTVKLFERQKRTLTMLEVGTMPLPCGMSGMSGR